MPLVRVSVRAGKGKEHLAAIGESIHQSLMETINVPAGDRFQIFTEHEKGTLVIDPAYLGIQRVSQKSGETAAQRAAMSKISARAPDDPNAADQLAYLSLLLGEDVDKSFAVAKKLTEQYPNRLSYRVTTALGYLRQHDPASALAQFKAPAPIDWKRTLPAWRAVYAAALLASDRNDEAGDIIATIPRDRLNPQERELIEPTEATK